MLLLKQTIQNLKRRTTISKIQAIENLSTQINVPRERVDCVVIGAGVVGIAVARKLASKGREVLVLDSASTFGTGISSRNSEVIHAGIYYRPNSLKAVLCVRGRELLYEYCSAHGVAYKQIGKLIVATGSQEIQKLYELMNFGSQNGVEGLKMLESFEAMKMEPELQCKKALLSPVSGIVDSHSLMLSLLGEAENHGTTFSYNSTVIGGHHEGDFLHLHIVGSKDLKNFNGEHPLHPELILVPKLVVNSAGLSSVALAKRFHGIKNDIIPPAHFARGCYFTLSGTKVPLFEHLIYPIPEDGGLGVHVTLDLDGQVKFGPDVEWIDGMDDVSSFLNKYDYSVCANRVKRFYPAIRRYYPNLKDGSLEPGYSGIRPKISGPLESPRDFIIQGEEIHGIRGLINLFGIESPGLTASLAIAEHITARFLKYDYSVCANRVKRFYPAIRRYYPNLKDGSLEPGYSGIRPKISGPVEFPRDFIIQGEEIHGIRDLINLFGIESPCLTASLAIADHVTARFLK